ncbi:hypothetical protein [Demequina sp. NBRC 110053]|uniref:hypothetical protein n=1 Tax=Demequina sp. NBRC 110053 TaxID=1570342 RepID=UPI0013564B09|nr:hypothetical protein [Demequina sp. NBRC 110053]
MAQKNNTRKHAAIALGIIGIAGLSLASAATLGVTEDSPLVGVSTGAECDDSVNVAYTTAYGATGFSTTGIKLSGVDAACSGKAVTVYVLNGSGNQIGSATGTLNATGSVTLTPASPIVSEQIRQAAVAIS